MTPPSSRYKECFAHRSVTWDVVLSDLCKIAPIYHSLREGANRLHGSDRESDASGSTAATQLAREESPEWQYLEKTVETKEMFEAAQANLVMLLNEPELREMPVGGDNSAVSEVTRRETANKTESGVRGASDRPALSYGGAGTTPVRLKRRRRQTRLGALRWTCGGEQQYPHEGHRLVMLVPDITEGAEPVPLPVLTLASEYARNTPNYSRHYPVPGVKLKSLGGRTLKRDEAHRALLAWERGDWRGISSIAVRPPEYTFSTEIGPADAEKKRALKMPGTPQFIGDYVHTHREIADAGARRWGGMMPFRRPDIEKGEWVGG